MDKIWDLYMVAILATNEEMHTVYGKKAIFINAQNSLQFNIKLISEQPESFPDVRFFTAYTSDIEDYGFEDDYNLSEESRIEKLKDFLRNYLIIFKPVKRGEHFLIEDVQLKIKPEAFQKKSMYISVPVFSERYHQKTFEEFKEQLLSRKTIGRIEQISHEQFDTPPVIIWKDNNKYMVIGEMDRHMYAYGGFVFEFEDLKYINFEKSWLGDSFEVDSNETLMFVGINIHLNMIERLRDNGVILSNNKEETQEESFLQNLIKTTQEFGLIYNEVDLINFHTCMKSSKLVILSGMSGTGKSKLVQVYGKALGLDDSQLNIIPVRPSWTDDADLIGYVDIIHHVYRPGDSGLINTLIQASKPENALDIYIICFDEMNLARVEHYFSQFLSVLEMDGSSRILRLYNDELESRLYNSTQYPPIVKIGENVLFVGTVNIDESTYNFSDKVLDRANVVTLSIPSFYELKEIKAQKKRRREKTILTEFKRFQDSDNEFKLSDKEIEFLSKLHEEIQNISNSMGIGFRIVKQIDKYLKNIPENSKLTRGLGLDFQIVQRIMTKIRGPQEQLEELIGKFDLKTDSVIDSKILNVLDKYKDISNFDKTKECIKEKAKELSVHGYTI